MNLLETHESELLAALFADLRKNPQEAYASEIGFVLNEIRHALRHLTAWTKPQKRKSPRLAWPARSHLQPEPYGVALIIGPWNYPLQLLLSPLVGAIAAGNCAILKPSEFAPQTAAVIDRLIRCTFSENFLTTIQGEQDTAESLLLEKFDTLFFTGSSQTGRAVMTAAARHLTPVTLELGGKCPCIVREDALIEITARRIVWGKFMNAGQTCVAPDHVWVDHRIAPALVAALRKTIAEFYGPSPQQCPDYGRIIHAKHLQRLTQYLSDGQIVCGGLSDPSDLFLAPTILTDVALDSPVMSEEIFGPILPILSFSHLDEVFENLRNRPKPLAIYAFTRDHAAQQDILNKTQSGGVCFNDTILQILGNDLPFGGLGDSGIGSYHGRASFDCFSHRRTVMRRFFALNSNFRYPPTRISLKILKCLMRLMG